MTRSNDIKSSHLAAPRNYHGTPGFTIFELIVVIFIIGSILALAIPRLFSPNETQLETDARKVAALIQYLDEAASTRKVYYRIRFDLDRELLMVEYSRDGVEYVNEDDARIGSLKLASGVEFEEITFAGLGSVVKGEVAATFSPFGNEEPFTLRLQSNEKNFLTLSFNPYTARVKVTERGL